MSDDLLEDADAKLARNEIELLGCYDVHPEPYENDPEAPEARRAFLENLLAPFLARIRELEAQLADGSFYKESDIDALQAPPKPPLPPWGIVLDEGRHRLAEGLRVHPAPPKTYAETPPEDRARLWDFSPDRDGGWPSD